MPLLAMVFEFTVGFCRSFGFQGSGLSRLGLRGLGSRVKSSRVESNPQPYKKHHQSTATLIQGLSEPYKTHPLQALNPKP